MKWKEHLAELCHCGVLKEVEDLRSSPRLYLRYFEVPKGTTKSRSIVDGTPLNDMCAKSPTLNLPSLAELFHITSCFPGGIFLTADVRHFFHQIRIPSEISPFLDQM